MPPRPGAEPGTRKPERGGARYDEGIAKAERRAGAVKPSEGVRKDTGKVERRLALGTKWPEYETTETGTVLFFQADEHEIDCYRF